jgi:biotin carboxylase
MSKNIFVFGLNNFNYQLLKSIKHFEEYEFHQLLKVDDLKDAEEYDFTELLAEAERELESFDGNIDAIVSFWDFPASAMLPVLCKKYGLPGPTLESVVKCGHKFWSRIEQKKVIPNNIPKFEAFDPFDDEALGKIELEFPFWIKPVKSYSSYLGFRINNEDDFRENVKIIRENINRFGDPYNQLLEHMDLPSRIEGVDANHCIAEELLTGKQCTVEGYSFNGEVNTFGLVDSYRYPNNVSFSRYQYPSTLPKRIRKRIDKISKKIIKHIGYDNAAFNIEYFYDREADKLMLLEINSRISQSHSYLFEKVDGASNHQVIVELALGHKPYLPKREGDFKVAGKLFLRMFEDGKIIKAPTQKEIDRIKKEFPETVPILPVHKGMMLSDVLDQDSYSYQIAILYMAAQSQKELLNKYDKAVEYLDYKIEVNHS